MANLNYLTGPSGIRDERPTLVFIHGAGGSANTWRLQLGDLDGPANTLAVDLPGHGASARPGRDTVTAYADAVLSLIDALALPNPIPVGLSMGGAITQQLLLDHPGRFPRAVLVSTGARLKVLPLIFEKLQNDFPGYLGLMGKFALGQNAPDPVRQEVLDDTAKQDPAVIAQDFRACDAFNVISRLPAITAAVLIVSAQQDFLTPPKYADQLHENIAGSRLVRVPDCGHMIPNERPAELADALREFLQGK